MTKMKNSDLNKFKIVLTGFTKQGVSIQEAEQNLSKLLNTELSKVRILLQGHSTTIKKNLNVEYVDQYRQALNQTGVEFEIIDDVPDLPSTSMAGDEISASIIFNKASKVYSENQSNQHVDSISYTHEEKNTVSTSRCPYCSEEIVSTAKKCKHCGEFLDSDMRNKQREKQSRRIIKPLFIAIILAIFSCGIAYLFIQKANEIAEIEAEKNAKISYQKKVAETIGEIFIAISKCVKMCSIYSEKWREGIAIEYYDISEYIERQVNEFKAKGDIADIRTSKTQIDELMSSLASPPKSMIDVHRKLVELYGIYSQVYNLALEPSGSLMSYNRAVNDLQSNFIKVADELKVMLPK